MQIYQIRDGVFALGVAGRKARAVATFSKAKNAYVGIRGVKPTIAKDAKPVKGSKALAARLTELKN